MKFQTLQESNTRRCAPQKAPQSQVIWALKTQLLKNNSFEKFLNPKHTIAIFKQHCVNYSTV